MERSGHEPGPTQGNTLVAPEVAASRLYRPDAELNAQLISQGIVARLIAPEAGIIRGTSATGSDGRRTSRRLGLLNRQVALHVHLYVSRSPRRITYPNSPMGSRRAGPSGISRCGLVSRSRDPAV